MRYSLSDGGVIDAGVKLGEGGEGVVYEALDGQRAIKLYHKPLAGRAADKLRAMVLADTLGLGAQAAWPQALITGPGGVIAGCEGDLDRAARVQLQCFASLNLRRGQE